MINNVVEKKTIKPILKTVCIGNNTQAMPFGNDLSFVTESYEMENVAAIAAKWLPSIDGIDRYKINNRGQLGSNDWIQIPTANNKFFIYERNPHSEYFTIFSCEKHCSDETPSWVGEWVDGNVTISEYE